ncbi:MAG TPA: hypothetical protein VL125_10935 [Pelobium sp.]|nr:hypothetical protein [Pelobium sp.]
MKKIYLIILLTTAVCIGNKSFAQKVTVERNSHFYVGVDIKIATLLTSTSIKSLFGIKAGYNQKLSNQLFAGPQVEALFIRSPINKGARISLFAGPATEVEVKTLTKMVNQANTTSLSGKMSWIFPINPKSSDYTFLDCISVGASFSNDNFLGFNKSSIGLNLDLQRYDIGFYNGKNRMLNINTNSTTSF